MRIVCCSCNKVKTNKGWRSLPVKVDDRPAHGFCPACLRKTLRMIEAYDGKTSGAASSP